MARRKETAVKKTTLYLPEPVWRQAKIRAMDEGTSLQAMALAALQAYLKTPKKESK
jgi:hypothetical protein